MGGDPRDVADGQSRNNFQLISAGGNDFLMLHLDWTVPGPALDWAQRVIDEHPGRRVLITTHIFMDADGRITDEVFVDRADGHSPRQIMNELVLPNCEVFLVLAGHFAGEAHDTRTNACGDPVHFVTVNFQSRDNGGDGWLRYLTFDPATDTIHNTTYSPVRERFERDADSDFDLSYDLADQGGSGFEYVGRRATTGDDVTGLRVRGLGAGRHGRYAAAPDERGTLLATTPVVS